VGIGLVYPKFAAHHKRLLLLQIKFIHFYLYKVNIGCPATQLRSGNLSESRSADPHAACCGGWGRKTPGYPILFKTIGIKGSYIEDQI